MRIRAGQPLAALVALGALAMAAPGCAPAASPSLAAPQPTLTPTLAPLDPLAPAAQAQEPTSVPRTPPGALPLGRPRFVPLDLPATLPAARATGLLPEELVLGLTVRGESRAYPVRMAWFHHVINDELASQPVLVTYWLKCSSGVGFDPVVQGRRLTFDLAGLKEGVFTLRDRETRTLWTHLDGRALAGPLAGQRLRLVPLFQVTWAEWREDHPQGTVLSLDTPYRGQYQLQRIGLWSRDEALYGDGRLPSNALVVGVEVEGAYRAYALPALAGAGGAVNAELGGEPIVVAYDPATGTGAAYSRRLEGQALTFQPAPASGRLLLEDAETGSRWDLEGRAISGSLEGKGLAYIPAIISEWYGWSAYHPETELFTKD